MVASVDTAFIILVIAAWLYGGIRVATVCIKDTVGYFGGEGLKYQIFWFWLLVNMIIWWPGTLAIYGGIIINREYESEE